MRLRNGLVTLVSCLSLLAVGCPKPQPELTPSDASTSDAKAMGDAAAMATASDGGGGAEDVEPVYPIEANAPAVPLAEKLCNALTTIPEKKRAECCKAKPGLVLTSECTRQLSAALRHDALTLKAADVDACVAALDKQLQGCDWVGPFAPGPPAACQGIFSGKLVAGQKCRSSLECQGDLRCRDLGPTTPGRCGAAGSSLESCGGTVDSLATYTLQNDVDKRHPECTDRCIKHKCQAAVREGEACLISSDCQDGMQCIATGMHSSLPGSIPKRCVTGKAPGKDGEQCPGGVCEGALQCIRGKCAARKSAGEACTDDFECKGGCLKTDGATSGKCGPRCDIR